MEHDAGRCCSAGDEMTMLDRINRLARNEVEATLSYFVLGHALISTIGRRG
jgi:hypothetical protein